MRIVATSRARPNLAHEDGLYKEEPVDNKLVLVSKGLVINNKHINNNINYNINKISDPRQTAEYSERMRCGFTGAPAFTRRWPPQDTYNDKTLAYNNIKIRPAAIPAEYSEGIRCDFAHKDSCILLNLNTFLFLKI